MIKRKVLQLRQIEVYFHAPRIWAVARLVDVQMLEQRRPFLRELDRRETLAGEVDTFEDRKSDSVVSKSDPRHMIVVFRGDV